MGIIFKVVAFLKAIWVCTPIKATCASLVSTIGFTLSYGPPYITKDYIMKEFH